MNSSGGSRKKKKRGGTRGRSQQTPGASEASALASILNRAGTPSSAPSPHAPADAVATTAPPSARPATYTLIAKEVPHDMLPGLLAADPELLGAKALRQRQLQGVPTSDVFIDFDHPPLRGAPGAETPMLVQLRSFFPVYPFNYCDTCLGRYHAGSCATAQHAHAASPLATPADGVGAGDEDDDDDLPPLDDDQTDSDDGDDDDDDDDDDDLPPLLDNSDLSDEEYVPPTRGSRGGAQPAAKAAKAAASSSSTQSRAAAAAGSKEEQPDGNYYDDYRYNPPLVYEQSISFITGKLPELRDFSRHRAAIFSFLLNHNVDVMQINGIQPTTTGFKVLLASSFALRGFEHQSECVVPTLGKVKIELFNGYRTDVKPGWHDTGNDDDLTDEEDYDDDGYYRQIPVDLRHTSTSKPAAKGAKAPAGGDDDDEPPPLLDCSSSEDEDDMPALDDSSDDDDESDDDYLGRRPTRSSMKPPRSAIVNRFKEAQEHQKQLDAQQKRLEVTRRQILEKQRLAQRREDAETAAIRFEDMISGVVRHKEWPCARSDCKNPVVFHYEKRVKAKCEKGCVMSFHKSCWQEVVKSQAPPGAQAKGERRAVHCPKCGARITSESLRINFGDKKKLYAEGLIAADVEQAGAAKNGSEGNTDSEERKREWLATTQRHEEEFKRRRDETERKRREQEEIAKREDEERRQKRRQERKQRKREKDRKGEPQMGEMVIVGKAGERAQPKAKPAAETGASIDPTAFINAAPDKVHVKKPERDVLPEAAKQDLERRMQRNAKKKQKKLKKRQAKSALRIYLDPSASTEAGGADEGSISATAAAEWPEEALRVARSEGYQLPAAGRSVIPIVHPVTGQIANQAALAAPAASGNDEEDIWAVPAQPTTTSHGH